MPNTAPVSTNLTGRFSNNTMNQLELGIVLICYSVAAIREIKDGNAPMAWVWACYAASLLGFMAMRVK